MNAIITGASRGIGRAIAQHLAAENYNLAICARNINELNKVKKELESSFPSIKIHIFQTDCADAEQVKDFAAYVDSVFTSVDVLVNNAGIFIPSSLMEENENDLALLMQVNVFTAHYLSKHFGRKMMLENRGHIFNICSVASLQPALNAGSYSISKFALLGLSKVLREELKESMVKVTAILPGSTLTSSWDGTSIPAEQFIMPDDVASALISCLKMSLGANVEEILIRPTQGRI